MEDSDSAQAQEPTAENTETEDDKVIRMVEEHVSSAQVASQRVSEMVFRLPKDSSPR